MERFFYRHFGLTIDSSLPLPTLIAVPPRASDVVVDVLSADELTGDLEWVPVDPPHTVWRATTPVGSRLRLRFAYGDEWAEFVVDEPGTRISLGRSDDVEDAEVAALLAGPVFSGLLADRGVTCIHAAVVAVGGRVAAVVGSSGSGKSTTASALLGLGARLIADDVAALTNSGGRPAALPGPPHLRMRPDSASALVSSLESLDPVFREDRPGPTKRYLSIDSERTVGDDGAVPLDAVYLLGPWDSSLTAPALRPVGPIDALPLLMANRHMIGSLAPASHRTDFAALGRLTRSVPVREVLRPAGLETAASVAAAIVTDIGAL